MSRRNEAETPGRRGEWAPVGQKEVGTEQRLLELEAENARLRAELAETRTRHDTDRDLLLAYMLDGMPRDAEQFRREWSESRPFGELIAELERESGPGTRS